MKALDFLAVTVAALSASGISAITLAPRSSSPRVISLDVERKSVNPRTHDRMRRRKRAGTVTETLDNEETLYFANVTLGTPAQRLHILIDTGSSDLWCNSASSSLCQQNPDPCTASGTYDCSSSSTYKLVNNNFNISYVDGSGASGNYVTDTLSIGGQTLSNFQFGVGTESTSAEGVLGIGYTSNEIQVNRNQQQAYPNLPAAMVDAGLIQTNAYSLWLNDLDAGTGQILFGGVNTAKYSGSLETVPIIQQNGSYHEFIIALTGISVGNNGASSRSSASGLPTPVLLDSGTSLMYLPNDLTTEIFNQVNAAYDPTTGAAYVDCSLANNETSISFSFSGATISVSYNELVLNASTNSAGQQLTFQDGVPACIFGIAPADDSTPILGDTFLRSAYVVYDLANNEISLAQTGFNSSSDNVQEISNGASGVPGATAVASTVTTVVAETGGARLGGPAAAATGIVSGAVPVQVPMAMAAIGLVGAIMAAP